MSVKKIPKYYYRLMRDGLHEKLMRNPNDRYSRNTLNVRYGFDTTQYPNFIQLVKALNKHLINKSHPDLEKVNRGNIGTKFKPNLPSHNKEDKIINDYKSRFNSNKSISVPRYSLGTIVFRRTINATATLTQTSSIKYSSLIGLIEQIPETLKLCNKHKDGFIFLKIKTRFHRGEPHAHLKTIRDICKTILLINNKVDSVKHIEDANSLLCSLHELYSKGLNQIEEELSHTRSYPLASCVHTKVPKTFMMSSDAPRSNRELIPSFLDSIHSETVKSISRLIDEIRSNMNIKTKLVYYDWITILYFLWARKFVNYETLSIIENLIEDEGDQENER